MSRAAATWIAWSLWAVFIALSAASLWLLHRSGQGLAEALVGGSLVFAATVGALVASRRPHNAVGWILVGIALAIAVGTFGEAYVTDATNPAYRLVGWVSSWSFWVWATLTAVFLPLVFPDGRLVSPRWWLAAWFGGSGLLLAVASDAFRPGELNLRVPVQNPLGIRGRSAEGLAVLGGIGEVVLAVAAVLAGASLVTRFRRARGTERQQLKWFALAGVLTIVGLVVSGVAAQFPGTLTDLLGSLAWITFLFSFIVGLPVATGIAILRHRLYDIDVVIKRTLVYGSLTSVLLGVYLGMVLALRLLLSPVTGDLDLAVAASTLAVAAAFRPARARIQAAVDRQFYRARFDASKTLERFAVHLRDETDLDTLGVDLRRVVADAMQPAHVSLWLRGAP